MKHERSRADGERELEHVRGEMEKLNEDMYNQASDVSGSKRKVEEAQGVRIIQNNMRESQVC